MRLVTPAKLKELLELERITSMTFTGRMRSGWKRFKKRCHRRTAVFREWLGEFFAKLWVDVKALFKLIAQLCASAGSAVWALLKRAWVFCKKVAILGYRRFLIWFKKVKKRLSIKLKELKQQYTQEREAQRSQMAARAARPVARAAGTRTAAASAVRRPVTKQASSAKTVLRQGGASPTRSRQESWFAPETRNRAPQRQGQPRRGAPARGNSTSRKSAVKKSGGLAQVFTAQWAQEHLRSLVAMGLLLLALIVFSFWGAFSDSGQKTLAQIGLGSARGYMLIGDEYLAENNYSRAVEYYYTSLTKDLSYEAALKLAIAYSYTGDISKEISALLICTENYPQNKLPFSQLYQLYPDGVERPARVQQAIEQGLKLYGSL